MASKHTISLLIFASLLVLVLSKSTIPQGEDLLAPIRINHHGSKVDKTNTNSKSMSNGKMIQRFDNMEFDMCYHVLQILTLRHRSVLNGERSRQFSQAYRGSSDKIISAHGGKLDTYEDKMLDGFQDVSDLSGGSVTSNDCVVQIEPKEIQLFPDDYTSLDFFICNNIYRDKKKQIVKEPSIFRLALRAIRLGINFFPTISTAGLAFVSSTFRSKYWYNLVSNGLSRSGPAFIKWGQWSSTRPDMFPSELCDALTDLHADAPSHSWRYTQKTVEESLSIPKGSLFEVFEEFETKPLASGSIAQVHRAILRPSIVSQNEINEKSNQQVNGAILAVKVRHPNVESLLDYDFRLMKFLANMVDKIPSLSWLNIKESVEQFSHTMAAQAHLDVEGHHLEVLNHNFRKWKHVGFPKPIFASDSVIIETFEKGALITDVFSYYESLVTNKSQNIDSHRDQIGNLKVEHGYELIPIDLAKFIVTQGASLYLKMMIEDGLMHADLHPGNILFRVHSGGTGWEVEEDDNGDRRHHVLSQNDAADKAFKASLTLVDAGMVAKLTPDESNNFIGLMVALGEGDGVKATKSVLNFSSLKDGDKDALSLEQKDAFQEDMIELFARICRGYGTNVDVGEVLRGVLNLIRIHRIRIDANYATLVVNALCVTAMAYKFVPEYNVLDASKPLFEAYNLLCASGDCGESKMKQSIMKTWLPLLYIRKNFRDNNFFRKYLKRKNAKLGMEKKTNFIQGPLVSIIKAASILALSAKGVDSFKKRADDDRRDFNNKEIPLEENLRISLK